MNEANMSRRQQIISMLKEGPISFMSIANRLGMPIKELKDDFDRVYSSIELESNPAKCKKCSFTFEGDRKYKTPSKCPSCREERIESQKFWIKE